MHDRSFPRLPLLRRQFRADLPQQVERALREDIGAGDLTAALIAPERLGRAVGHHPRAAIICGVPYVAATFEQLDRRVALTWHVAEGDSVVADQLLFTLAGPARALLTGERTALNFLQLLSATATAAHRYVELIRPTGTRLLDTRKTIPGLRTAQKYAVRVGGGNNHRMGLFDGVLIKENHIVAAVPSLWRSRPRGAIRARCRSKWRLRISTSCVRRSRPAPTSPCSTIFPAVDARGRRAECGGRNTAALGSSGGISHASIRAIAETGVDFISVGSITKNVSAIDLSMRFAWDG